MNREVETDRFRVRRDNGEEYEIIEYQTMVSFGHMQDPGAEKPGFKRLATSAGIPVEIIDAETFKIGGTDEIVRKI